MIEFVLPIKATRYQDLSIGTSAVIASKPLCCWRWAGADQQRAVRDGVWCAAWCHGEPLTCRAVVLVHAAAIAPVSWHCCMFSSFDPLICIGVRTLHFLCANTCPVYLVLIWRAYPKNMCHVYILCVPTYVLFTVLRANICPVYSLQCADAMHATAGKWIPSTTVCNMLCK